MRESIALESVQVGLLGIPDDRGIIPGLLLVFSSREDLDAFFGAILEYFESTPRPTRRFDINFTSSPSEVSISIEGERLTTTISITDIEPGISESLQESLRERPFYFLLGGVRSGSPEGFDLLGVDGHHVFKGDFNLDGVPVVGNKQGYWPPGNPLKSTFGTHN